MEGPVSFKYTWLKGLFMALFQTNEVHSVSPDIVIDFLNNTLPFKELPKEEIHRIARQCIIDFFPKGTILLKQDETEVNHLYLIQKGGVKIYLIDEGGEITLKDFRGEGSYIGALPIIQGTKANLNVETVEDTFCFLLDKETFLKLIEQYPRLAQYYLQSFSEKFVRTAYRELRQHKISPRTESALYLFSLRVGDFIKRKPETISGSRFHVMPEVSAPLNFNGIKITPSMAMDFTKYNLHTANDNSHSMSSVSPERAVPIYSLDLTGVFQKTWKNGRYLQTLEPRILRVYIPYRNQDDFPIFDTIVPDMNGIQLFRKNRYVGQDRLGDTSQISYGITTKVVDANNGNSLFGLTLGQIRYFKDRKVALPSESKLTQDSSGYMAMMNMKINKNWSVKLGHMWNTHSNTSMKTTARFQYKSKQSEIFNVAYRYRRNMLKQLDASFSWPVRDHWNVVGRYNYSILDRKVLERFVGLEYESCCWGIRVISRKHLAYRNGDTDTSFSIEFVFKGLSDIGDPVENLLDRGILGYDLE